MEIKKNRFRFVTIPCSTNNSTVSLKYTIKSKIWVWMWLCGYSVVEPRKLELSTILNFPYCSFVPFFLVSSLNQFSRVENYLPFINSLVNLLNYSSVHFKK